MNPVHQGSMCGQSGQGRGSDQTKAMRRATMRAAAHADFENKTSHLAWSDPSIVSRR